MVCSVMIFSGLVFFVVFCAITLFNRGILIGVTVHLYVVSQLVIENGEVWK